jgi:Tfp pilus assembly protein PilF
MHLKRSISTSSASAPGVRLALWAQALFTLASIARTARQMDDRDFAASAATQMIEHDPNYGGSHYALALVARQRGDDAKARSELALARKHWKNADPDVQKLVTS